MKSVHFQKTVTALMVAVLLTSSFAIVASATALAVPVTQSVRARQVRGTLPGGQFAKIWLGLEPETPSAQVSVVSEWDRADAGQNGVGFFIIDADRLPQAQAGEALSGIAVAAGTANFVNNAADNSLGASLNAAGLTPYTLVVYNDSNSDANFTLTATGAFISDASNQVTNPNATAVVTTTVPAPATGITTTTQATTTTPVVVATPAPAATVATTGTVSTTTTTTTAPATTTTPAITTPGTPVVVSATQLQGDLPTQNAQHFLGLKPGQRDAEINLSLTYDPQDSSELARRLNFWVMDQSGFAQFIGGTNPSDVAIAAGNRTFRDDTNERVANFRVAGEGDYVVLVYNNSQVPGSYSLSITGGTLIDNAGQTRNALQAAASRGITGTTTATTTGVTPVTTPVAATSTSTTTTATTTGRTGTPGGTYTVRSGDTVALIARDIYGDYLLYQQICTFNGITDCNTIEVGDVIKLPTQPQISANATQPAVAATPAPTRAATTVAPVTATTPTTATRPTTSTTTTVRPVAATTAITPTATVTNTTPVTRTTPVTSTGTATGTAGTTDARDIIDTAVANGGFKTLVAALEATGLDATLQGPGPFTVFAPTDAAFASLPTGALDQLLANPSGQLTDILRFHVIAGRTATGDLSNGLQATTVQGQPVKFEVAGNTIKINGATILTKDIQTSNGVIHVINQVIIPPPE
ncbi:MAG: fasciclin domain-containing protein [Chloroflexota bacterium]|nr:fasciclin domain-containing protein [Chloroflexota bacterium]